VSYCTDWRTRADSCGEPQVHNARTGERVESLELAGGGATCVSAWTSSDGTPFLLVGLGQGLLIITSAFSAGAGINLIPSTRLTGTHPVPVLPSGPHGKLSPTQRGLKALSPLADARRIGCIINRAVLYASQVGQSDGSTRLYELVPEGEGEGAERRRRVIILPGETADGYVPGAHAFVAEGRHRLVTSYYNTRTLRFWDLGEAPASEAVALRAANKQG
jgi:hypothetical protein